VSEHLTQLPVPGDALLERSNRWQEAFWSSHRTTSTVLPRRRQVVWSEQSEFWPGEVLEDDVAAPAAPADAEPMQRSKQRPIETTRPRIRSKPKAVAPAVVRRSTSQSYAEQPKTVRTADIARYLQVNGAVHGANGASWFALPQRRFAAGYERSLWKGRPVGTPFVSGC
jgi:hypothetical protein